MAVAAGTLRHSCPHRRRRHALARCDREAQALAGLSHPHIARVYGIVHERDVTDYDRDVSEADADLIGCGVAGATLGVLSIGPLLYLLGQKRCVGVADCRLAQGEDALTASPPPR